MGIEKELTCYIFAGAPMEFLPPVSPEPGDLILCADGGYRYAKALGLKPDYLVGDFDTLPEGEIWSTPIQGADWSLAFDPAA